jgi:hypothetical protein
VQHTGDSDGNPDAHADTYFSLTKTGALLKTPNDDETSSFVSAGTRSGMRACIQHWTEEPLWNAGHFLPQYITGKGNSKGDVGDDHTKDDPFTMANGQSSDFYYNQQEHPQSLQYANDFVKFISQSEIEAAVNSFDWSMFEIKQFWTLVVTMDS